ncbi:Uncharacterised protein [Chryseobacterium taklimakanense]|uniref:Uncharacterized protein n=1 Tax=Chryseobacterium taklimakanense TaxID=536441 RepID=A0A239WLC3_9FLAO|nr:peptidoglycan-binding protein [Chryseobacterium taklimakanense]SNV34693.1 Uncharacterised protein [Chryseobacterium taklimakanense]
MGKKGVSLIKGATRPTVGKLITYNIADWYPDTPASERRPQNVTWELFKKRKSGKFTTTTIKKKGVNTFTFGEGAVGSTYLLHGYLYHPEGDGLIITPQPAVIPKIEKVVLQYIDDTPGEKFSFKEKLRCKAFCTNMLNKELVFTLWEDDAKDKGHDPSNKAIASKKANVKTDGIATAEFTLTEALMKKAMEGEVDVKQLEFYVTVEYFKHKKHPTGNVYVNNPEAKIYPEKKSQKKPATPPAAPGSPAEQKGKSQKVEKGILDKIGETWDELWDWWETKGTAKKDQQPTVQKPKSTKSAAKVENSKATSQTCGGKYCIKKGDKSELIREINIRLAGFGGNVPTDEFTDRTEKMIKQFQKDYMKVPETGKICGNVLRAIDEFQSKYPLNFDEIRCKCGSCNGFGKERNSEEYQNAKILEKHRKFEYPGVHRSLLWCYRATLFYVNRDAHLNFKTKWVESGYRCHNHYIYIRDKTTNHCGKALDIHYNILSTGKRTKSNSDMNKIRKEIFKKYTGAKEDWNSGKDIFYLESFATTWIHVDVREFSQEYLVKKYFVKNTSDLNGKNIITLANELGYGNMCLCGGNFKSTQQQKPTKNEKSKWSHTEFANLIAKEESRDNYNICNQTKGGLKIINNLKIVELTIKEVQEKQKNRDVFAVGRYQLIPDTLNSAIRNLGLDTNEKLNEEIQDKIFDEYLIKVKRSKVIDFLEGNGNVEDAMYSLAQEWASIGVEKGKRISDKIIKKDKKVVKRIVRHAEGGESYYAGDGLNKSHITPEQMKNALINSKNENK